MLAGNFYEVVCHYVRKTLKSVPLKLASNFVVELSFYRPMFSYQFYSVTFLTVVLKVLGHSP